MTKPLTHALPYLVGLLLGRWIFAKHSSNGVFSTLKISSPKQNTHTKNTKTNSLQLFKHFLIAAAISVALIEVFLPYRWNNSQLPGRLATALYAAAFRFGWSLVLACTVLSCRHRRSLSCCQLEGDQDDDGDCDRAGDSSMNQSHCFCATGGSLVNRFLSLSAFKFLSKLSFVAYLVHFPLMSVFVAQTRGLFAFSHTLVIHLALSYLVISFALSFVLVHIIEYPFITLEAFLTRNHRSKLEQNNSANNCRVQNNNVNFNSPPDDSMKESISWCSSVQVRGATNAA